MDNSGMYKVQTRHLFHCTIKIKIPVDAPDYIFSNCFAIMAQISQQYNAHDHTSYFYAMNQHNDEFVDLDATAVHLLKILKSMAEASQGAYDFTIMPLLRLWGFYQNKPLKPPSTEQINHILGLVDFKKIQISGLQAKLAKGQEIATGSFIKSFAVDQVIFYLKQQGITDALVNAGGSTISALNNHEHPYWTIAFATGDGELAQSFKVKLSNQSFSLSTVINNFIVLDQVKYGHILSPETGQPSTHLISAVISDLAFYSDIFSTSLFAQQQVKMQSTIHSLSHLFPFDYFVMNSHQDIDISKGFREAMLTNA